MSSDQGSPDGAKASQSLWEALHDTEITSIISDPLERSIRVRISIKHLLGLANLPLSGYWVLIGDGVTQLKAERFEFSPTPPPMTKGLSYEEQSRLVRDWQRLGRSLSVDWEAFEKAVSTEGIGLGDASLRRLERGVLFSAGGNFLDNDDWVTFEILANEFHCEQSDGKNLSLEDLMDLGGRYWEAFAARRPGKNNV